MGEDNKPVNVGLIVNGYPLDPSRSYIIEVKAGDMTDHTAEGLVNALQQLKIKHVLVATETGKAINVVETPEEAN